MTKTGFEVVARAAIYIFIKGLLCDARKRHRVERDIELRRIVSPMGDTIGYIVDGKCVPLKHYGGDYEC